MNSRFLLVFYKQFKAIPDSELRITWATLCTFVRIILTPFIVCAILCEQWILSIVLFLIAALTDLCDGMIARFCEQQTFLGAWLDPVADKILMIATFCALYTAQSTFLIPCWFLIVLIMKEIIQLIGALVLYGYCNATVIAPTALGKITTGIQAFFILSLSCMHLWNIYYKIRCDLLLCGNYLCAIT
jgi:cardiolipin synthase (CMP-forming)